MRRCFCLGSVQYLRHAQGVGSSHRDRPISVVVLHVFRDSERDTGGGGAGWLKNANFSVT